MKKIIGIFLGITSAFIIYLSFDSNYTKGDTVVKISLIISGIVCGFIAFKFLKSKEKIKNLKTKETSKKEIELQDNTSETLNFISSNEKEFLIPPKMKREELIKIFEQNTDKTIVSSVGGLFVSSAFISVDDKNNIFYIGNNIKVYKCEFSKLSNFEYFEDGDVIISGKTLSTVAGGLAFGALGALAGASGKRKQKNEINNVSLKIYLKDLNNPQITLTLLNQKAESKSTMYQLARTRADEMLGLLNYIKNKEI